MKRMLTLIIALALIVTPVLSALAAELPESLAPTELVMKFTSRLANTFMTMGDKNPAGTTAKYALRSVNMLDKGMKFSNSDGTVWLEAVGASGEFDPSSAAGKLTFTVSNAVNIMDATALKLAFLGAISDLDTSATYQDLMEWLPESSRSDSLVLNGYTLSYEKDGAGQSLILVPEGFTEAPAETQKPAEIEKPAKPEATPVPTRTAELPEFFIPQTAASWFNGLLGPTLEMLGAPNPGDLVEQFELTKADIVDNVLFLSNADGKVEINAYFEDGQPAVDKQATTLGLGIAKDLGRSEVLSVSATFAYMLAQVDDTVEDFVSVLDWMADAVDNGESAMLPMNGYSLVYAKGENGYMYTLVPDGVGRTSSEPTTESTPEPVVEATPEPTPEPVEEPAKALDGAVLSWKGLSIKPLKYSINAYDSEYVSLRLYFRVLNDTDQLIWVDVENIAIDGNTDVNTTGICKAQPHTDSGEDSSDYALITANADAGTSGLDAIVDARRVTMSVVLEDEHFDKLYTEDLTLDLDALEGDRNVPADFKAAAATPTPKPYTLSASDYTTLKKGSKGPAVRDLQQRLIDLGYLDDKADGVFGKNTAAGVRSFCEQNGLTSDGTASPQMQALLFSSSAKYYSEIWIPLIIGDQGKWDPVKSVNTFFFKTQVTNTSKTRTIRGFELKCYTTDVWGNKLDKGVTYTMTNTVRVKPGETVWSNSFNLGNWYSVDTVWFGISKIVFDDGEIRTVDDVDYYSCVITSKK